MPQPDAPRALPTPATGREGLRSVGQSLSLALWRRPAGRPATPGFGAFLAACMLSLALFLLQDRALTPGAADFFSDNFGRHAAYFLAVLAAAWIAARILRRDALWLSIATLAVLVGTAWNALASWVLVDWLGGAGDMRAMAWHVLLALGGFIALWQMFNHLSRASSATRRLAATLVFTVLLAWPWYRQQDAWFWYPPDAEASTAAVGTGADAVADDAGDAGGAQDANAADDDASEAPAPRRVGLPADVDPERLMESQPARVQAAVDAVRAQTPGRIDLFTVGFAGDGAERVFRNEVDYLAELAARRFDGRGRTLELLNSPATLGRAPLATLSNLRDALAGVAARMDPDEDVLLLFLTSHGHDDHRLYVGFDPLPLRQISPLELRAALDDAHVGWRVVVVSACYSGGFVDALRDSRTLVITAARADRASFGCGSDSDITWFGKAYLTQAMNQTTDFERGFDLASHAIREWELQGGETPSVPQIAAGAGIRRQLAAWRAQLPPAPPVPFLPDGRSAKEAPIAARAAGPGGATALLPQRGASASE